MVVVLVVLVIGCGFGAGGRYWWSSFPGGPSSYSNPKINDSSQPSFWWRSWAAKVAQLAFPSAIDRSSDLLINRPIDWSIDRWTTDWSVDRSIEGGGEMMRWGRRFPCPLWWPRNVHKSTLGVSFGPQFWAPKGHRMRTWRHLWGLWVGPGCAKPLCRIWDLNPQTV